MYNRNEPLSVSHFPVFVFASRCDSDMTTRHSSRAIISSVHTFVEKSHILIKNLKIGTHTQTLSKSQ